MNMSYKCEIIADSLSPQGNRLTTYVVTYPRIVHAEMCRHRMHSRNTASSRAIPFSKMVKEVKENPFIPIAWQKSHKGMQGTKYFTEEDIFEPVVQMLPNKIYKTGPEIAKRYWLWARDQAVDLATRLNDLGVTKQLCNRFLEPFVWTTEIITGTEWDNFFELRNPKYEYYDMLTGNQTFFKSKKDWLHYHNNKVLPKALHLSKLPDTNLEWLQINKSQAEIHIQRIAEMIWDAKNQSTPKNLKPGEWHIPFGDKFDINRLEKVAEKEFGKENTSIPELKIKIATARCARVSYINFEGKDDYEADIKLHDRLINMRHWSPFEHCARAMSNEEYNSIISGKVDTEKPPIIPYVTENILGWCRNFRGFVSYRYMLETYKI